MSEQRRVTVVFSSDELEATVTCEVYRGRERIAAVVRPPAGLDNDLVALAKQALDADVPRLF